MELAVIATDIEALSPHAPGARTSFDTVVESARCHDAYSIHGSLERILIVANRVWEARAAGLLSDCNIEELRTALYVTQRGWHRHPMTVDVGVEWELLQAIATVSGCSDRDD